LYKMSSSGNISDLEVNSEPGKDHEGSLPRVSVVIPVRNEEKYLGSCLESIAAQDYPHDLLEILVVDGSQNNRTSNIARQYADKNHLNLRILENPHGNTPCGLNIGYKNARGDIFIHFIGHAIMPSDFVSKNISYLREKNADAVGGLVESASIEDKIVPKAIGYALNSLFGLGGVTARTGTKERYIDNPSFGAYKKELFQKYGYIDERLTRNQDYEFNQRITSAGAKIYFTPEIRSKYYNRTSYGSLFKEYFNAARWRTFMIGRFVRAVRLRHLAPPLFFLAVILSIGLSFFIKPFTWILLGLLGIYSVVALGFSIGLSIRTSLRFFPAILITYPVIHIGYGIGFIIGIFEFILFGKGKKVIKADAQ